MVGLVTILKDCLESSHFRRQWASSVRQLVGTAHQQETSSEAARRWRCPAPFLSSTAHCIEVYISVNFGISVSSQNLVFSFIFLQARGGLEQYLIGEWKVPSFLVSHIYHLNVKIKWYLQPPLSAIFTRPASLAFDVYMKLSSVTGDIKPDPVQLGHPMTLSCNANQVKIKQMKVTLKSVAGSWSLCFQTASNQIPAIQFLHSAWRRQDKVC